MSRQARATTPFGRETTAREVVAGVDLSGRRAIVTGGSSGLGLETARALASAGAEVTLAVRNPEAGERAIRAIAAETGNSAVHVLPLELTDRASVVALVDAWREPLHILVNNAGVMGVPELRRTADGWETHFAANHLGHLALAIGLHDALAAAGGARVVSVSSSAHAFPRTGVDLDDSQFERRPYSPQLAYAQSKTANVLFAVEASRRWLSDGIVANALNPGGVRTNLHRHRPEAALSADERAALENWPWRTAAQGAATAVLLAASPLVDGVAGRYFENCTEAEPIDPNAPLQDRDAPGVARYAIDPDAAAQLWELSSAMLRRAGWIA
jgi:NAD(P)-dependent dehydrogenase (short-subunit alcohol dehydrogenase family)